MKVPDPEDYSGYSSEFFNKVFGTLKAAKNAYMKHVFPQRRECAEKAVPTAADTTSYCPVAARPVTTPTLGTTPVNVAATATGAAAATAKYPTVTGAAPSGGMVGSATPPTHDAVNSVKDPPRATVATSSWGGETEASSGSSSVAPCRDPPRDCRARHQGTAYSKLGQYLDGARPGALTPECGGAVDFPSGLQPTPRLAPSDGVDGLILIDSAVIAGGGESLSTSSQTPRASRITTDPGLSSTSLGASSDVSDSRDGTEQRATAEAVLAKLKADVGKWALAKSKTKWVVGKVIGVEECKLRSCCGASPLWENYRYRVEFKGAFEKVYSRLFHAEARKSKVGLKVMSKKNWAQNEAQRKNLQKRPEWDTKLR